MIFFMSAVPYPNRLKTFLLRLFGAQVGRGVLVKPRVNIKYPWFLKIGDFTWIGGGTWIDNLATVKIGSNVCLSQGSYLCTGNHDYK
jgi:putative colanic acid biosynthesis acetyltransferase WcaF